MAVPAKITKEAFGKFSPETVAAMKLVGLEYIDVEGELLLKVDPVDGYSLESRDVVQATLNKERKAREAAEARITAWGDLDPDKTKKDLARIKEMETWVPDEKAKRQLESALKELDQKYAPQLLEKDAKIEKMRAQIERALVDNVATQAITEAKGRVKGLLPHVKAGIKVIEQNGEYVARVINPADGTERYSRSGKLTEPMTIKEYVESMRSDPELEPLFSGTGVAGPGTQTRTTPSNGKYTVSAAQVRDNPRIWESTKAAAQAAGVEAQMTD